MGLDEGHGVLHELIAGNGGEGVGELEVLSMCLMSLSWAISETDSARLSKVRTPDLNVVTKGMREDQGARQATTSATSRFPDRAAARR